MVCQCSHTCTCSQCQECREKACRCCAQLNTLSPVDLARAHTAHATALAHLELALAALDTLPTDGWLNDLYKDPRKALQDAKEAISARTPNFVKNSVTETVKAAKSIGNAVMNDNKKVVAAAYRKLVPATVKKALENSRGGKAMAAAGIAATTEHETAGHEHTTIQEEFAKEAAAKEAKEAAAKEAKEAAAKEAKEAAATLTPGVNAFHKFQLADSQTYLV